MREAVKPRRYWVCGVSVEARFRAFERVCRVMPEWERSGSAAWYSRFSVPAPFQRFFFTKSYHRTTLDILRLHDGLLHRKLKIACVILCMKSAESQKFRGVLRCRARDTRWLTQSCIIRKSKVHNKRSIASTMGCELLYLWQLIEVM